MPIQNVGTLLENLVVAETAALLLDRIEPDESLGLATAFAMPVLSEWRRHSQSVGISSGALQQIATSSGGGDFVDVIRRCLRHRPDRGPNGALIVSLLATLRQAHLNLWANDVHPGHYGDAIPSLRSIEHVVQEILPGCIPSITVDVCDVEYPASLDHLRATMAGWKNVGPVIGFLDPCRYVCDQKPGPYTHSVDHRDWLASLRNFPCPVALHFTGNRASATLLEELKELREDLARSNFPHWLEVRRQHYVVSVGARDGGLLDKLERRISESWSDWCDRVPEIKTRRLTLLRSSDSGAPRLTPIRSPAANESP